VHTANLLPLVMTSTRGLDGILAAEKLPSACG